jgi:lysozyme family protein
LSGANFTASVAFTLSQEGGFVDNPTDPGGATNKGITLATLRSVVSGATVQNLKAMSDEIASSIYWSRYWNMVAADKLPSGIDLMVFDMAVNAGPVESAKLLQRCVGTVDDGVIGPHTIAAATAAKDLLSTLGTAQMQFYLGLSGFQTFGHGWTRRIFARIVAAARLPGVIGT